MAIIVEFTISATSFPFGRATSGDTDVRVQLERLDLPEESTDADRMQEVWSLTGNEAIEARTDELLEQAESEIVLVVVDEEMLTEALFDRLHEAGTRGVDIILRIERTDQLGGETDAIVARLESELSAVKVFETDLGWLVGPESDDEVAISRLLLVDRTTLLVSSFYPDDGPDASHEQAVFANGLGNGVVVLIRRVLSSGLLHLADPAR